MLLEQLPSLQYIVLIWKSSKSQNKDILLILKHSHSHSKKSLIYPGITPEEDHFQKVHLILLLEEASDDQVVWVGEDLSAPLQVWHSHLVSDTSEKVWIYSIVGPTRWYVRGIWQMRLSKLKKEMSLVANLHLKSLTFYVSKMDLSKI